MEPPVHWVAFLVLGYCFLAAVWAGSNPKGATDTMITELVTVLEEEPSTPPTMKATTQAPTVHTIDTATARMVRMTSIADGTSTQPITRATTQAAVARTPDTTTSSGMVDMTSTGKIGDGSRTQPISGATTPAAAVHTPDTSTAGRMRMPTTGKMQDGTSTQSIAGATTQAAVAHTPDTTTSSGMVDMTSTGKSGDGSSTQPISGASTQAAGKDTPGATTPGMIRMTNSGTADDGTSMGPSSGASTKTSGEDTPRATTPQRMRMTSTKAADDGTSSRPTSRASTTVTGEGTPEVSTPGTRSVASSGTADDRTSTRPSSVASTTVTGEGTPVVSTAGTRSMASSGTADGRTSTRPSSVASSKPDEDGEVETEVVTVMADDMATLPVGSDIRVTGLTPSTPVEYFFDRTNEVTFSVTIKNMGTIGIPDSDGGDNYRFSFVLSGDENLADADGMKNLTHATSTNSSFDHGLAASENRTYEGFELTVTVPAVECVNYSYICVRVHKGSGANYTDPDDSNNHACLQFGPFGEGYAGIYRCADIDVVGLEVTYQESAMLSFEVDNIGTFAVLLRNSGPYGIPAPDTGNNFNLTFMLSNTTDLSSDGAGTLPYQAETSRSEDLDEPVPGGGRIQIRNIDVYVNIPSTVCEDYRYMCVVVTQVAGTNFTDSNPDNNDLCILFGDVEKGFAGALPCSGCLLETSLFIIALVASSTSLIFA